MWYTLDMIYQTVTGPGLSSLAYSDQFSWTASLWKHFKVAAAWMHEPFILRHDDDNI